jgi:hypothetical protein
LAIGFIIEHFYEVSHPKVGEGCWECLGMIVVTGIIVFFELVTGFVFSSYLLLKSHYSSESFDRKEKNVLIISFIWNLLPLTLYILYLLSLKG